MEKRNAALWAGVHFLLEVVCYMYLIALLADTSFMENFIFVIIYDVLAFYPQYLIGAFCEKHPRFSPGLTGGGLVLLGLLMGGLLGGAAEIAAFNYAAVGFIAAGNAFIHVAGAEATLYTGKNRITPAAVFVAGGAFGVGVGIEIGSYTLHHRWEFLTAFFVILIIAALLMCGLIVVGEWFRRKTERITPSMHTANPKINVTAVILLAFLATAIRGFASYGAPHEWAETTFDYLLIYAVMTLGKALGGVCTDRFGARITALIPAVLSVPLLILGEEIGVIWLVGTLLSSMTMGVALSVLVSAMPERPLTAYGLTTVALLVGTMPIMIEDISDFICKPVNLIIYSASSVIALLLISAPREKHAPVSETGKE